MKKTQPTELWFIPHVLGEQPIYFAEAEYLSELEYDKLLSTYQENLQYTVAVSNYGRRRLVKDDNGFICILPK